MVKAELIAYVRGPISENPGILQKFLGALVSRDVYYVNPQFYIGNSGAPSLNWGVLAYPFNFGEAPDRRSFEGELEQDLRARLGRGVQISEIDPIIPAETIAIKVEYED